MADVSLRPPPILDLSATNLSETFKQWRQQIEIYLLASGATTKDNKIQKAIILHCAGPRVIELEHHFAYANDEEKNSPHALLTKLGEYCNPRKNVVMESHRFWKLSWSEPFHAYLTQLRSRVEACEYHDANRMIRDKIVFTAPGKLQEILLRETQLTLDKAIDLCRIYESSIKQAQEMQATPSNYNETSVRPSNAIQTIKRSANRLNTKPHQQERVPNIDCRFCGKNHKYGRNFCPAYGKQCTRCHGRNHFKATCQRQIHQVHDEDHVQTDREDDLDLAADAVFATPTLYAPNYTLHAVGKSQLTALLRINDTNVRFQLDTGADINTINKRFVRPEQIYPTQKMLTMWNKTKLKPEGEATLNVTNPKNAMTHSVKFMVVNDSLNCLLGLETVQMMNLISVNAESFIAKITANDDLGNLGVVSLHIDHSVRPKVLPSRNIPIALRQTVKTKLDQLVQRKVISPVHDPTDWVSQMAIVKKTNGDIRICIDPQPLNTALKREHYKLPVLDDILPDLSHAKVFSKLDVKEAYWHIALDEASSNLTTMITPFGRYKWNRQPFGLKVSSEIFQKKLVSALAGLKGVFAVADDVIVIGCGETEKEAMEDHEKNLTNLQERCCEQGIRLNEEKAVLRKTSITFMGHLITNKGIEADPRKVTAITKMPMPNDVSGVKRLCGMVQYLAKFMPNLATDLEPLRKLTRKNVPWVWSKDCDNAVLTIKKKISTPPLLVYFDETKPLMLQVDSSKSGLGAVLLQDGKPIEYASRALTPAEQNWAQIEKETLSMVYGLERFDQYTYGRKVVICNDHKPMDMILRKPLSQAPKRLQALIMRLNRYDIEFQYVPGAELVLADTLSRAVPDQDFPFEHTRVMQLDTFEMIADERLKQIKEATATDTELQNLLHVIQNGWPDHKNQLSDNLKPYFALRDTLSCEAGIVLKGERVVIPRSQRSTILQQLHAAHLGAESMSRRARATVFWLGLNNDLKQMADNCRICQEHKSSNQREPLTQHEEGQYPWEKCGVDLFECNGKMYLICVDYYSNFIEIDVMYSTTAQNIVYALKKNFARYGIPKMVVSDCGPQFTSEYFQSFCKSWCITHVTSSPGHQRENGRAEAAVKSIKYMLKKTASENADQYLALLEMRNTPRQDVNRSPAELAFGRNVRSIIPAQTKPSGVLNTTKREQRKKAIKKHYDQHAKPLPELKPGDKVFFQSPHKEGWEQGIVTKTLRSRTYIVKNPHGTTFKRNRVHIRKPKSYKAPDIYQPAPWFPPMGSSSTEAPTDRTALEEMNTRPCRERRMPARFENFVMY